MDIRDPLVLPLFTTFTNIFQESLDCVQDSLVDKLATKITSSGQFHTNYWLSKRLSRQRWISTRALTNLSLYATRTENKKYSQGFKVERTLIEDDMVGAYGQAMKQMGNEAGLCFHRSIALALKCGTSGSYTAASGEDTNEVAELLAESHNYWSGGSGFFSAAHPVSLDYSLGTQSNNLQASALTVDTFATAYQTLINMKGNDGKPLGLLKAGGKVKLIVPPQLWSQANKIANNSFLPLSSGDVAGSPGGGTAENVWKGMVEVVTVPDIGDQATTWYVAVADAPTMPFLVSVRKEPEFQIRMDSNDPLVFDEDCYAVAWRARGTVIYAIYQAIVRCTTL